MTFPKSVEIGGMTFSIVVEDGIADHGQFCFDDKRITIRNADSKMMLETLRHEMLHAAFSVSGISFSKYYDEEPITRCIENIYFPALDKLNAKIKRK
jgi:predicted transcriptional regulator